MSEWRRKIIVFYVVTSILYKIGLGSIGSIPNWFPRDMDPCVIGTPAMDPSPETRPP